MQDPIFEPWSVGERSPSSPDRHAPSPASRVPPRSTVGGTVEFLRAVALPYLEAAGRRLRVARHRTTVEDLLDSPPGLLRFELTPWAGPFSEGDPAAGALLEIGAGSESNDLVTAWYWLDRGGEAPHEVAGVPRAELDAAWVERVILDFVSKVLERS